MNLSTLTLTQLKQIAATKNIIPAGDKRKKQTWIDAIQAQEQDTAIAELSEEMDAYFEQDIEQLELALLKEATQGGDRPIVLGEWLGHEHYSFLMQQAVAAIGEDIKMYEALYERATELNMEISDEWRKLRNDTQVVRLKDENADMWAGFNARRAELGF